MAELIAQGPEAPQRWRRTLPADEPVVLGRSEGTWAVTWDGHVSRRHAELIWRNSCLEVRCLPTGRNPILVRGAEAATFTLLPGESFVIGTTTFTLSNEQPSIVQQRAPKLQEHTYSAQELLRVPFSRNDRRLEVLSQLPTVISGSASDSELFVRLVALLLSGVEQARAAAVVACNPAHPDSAPIEILQWDQRGSRSGEFHPSERLIRDAFRQRKTVLHAWQEGGSSAGPAYTSTTDIDWAYCTPGTEDANAGLAFYVAGQSVQTALGRSKPLDPAALHGDLKFTELAAAILNALRKVRRLQQQHSVLSQFLSPVVVGQIAEEDAAQLLAARETRVTVLFCDLRGFSRESEKQADNLLGLLERVSQALHVMTHNILDQGGVIADFQGDAAMGFWGWPVAQANDPVKACQAALKIRAEFEAAAHQPGHALANFRVGIGMATGVAVAGKIGTVEQAKVGVFGPVVNRASRLEGMTKILHAPILVDEDTAQVLRQQAPRELARLRRLAVVQPYGMEQPVTVSEVLPPFAEYPVLSDEDLACYEAALEAFQAGRWAETSKLLHRLPPEDRVKDVLTVHIVQSNYVAPPGWSGVMRLDRKS
jgi:adenylate cyclase